MGFKVNKIGFVNFWLYDEEEYYFCDGKLLLRGKNGSGKTVTMQSFFPLIFDGNKSPERLDPFGSRDRKIEDYLLLENSEVNENTGYLYMEFFNKETSKYLTLGIGLKAIKNRPTEFWGFLINDGRRIGTDFLLFKERNLRVPLTKKELQIRLGTGGIFTETIKDYKKMVNDNLFGFSNIDLYTEFINLIIQIRSPKLSNSTKPSQLTQILSSVLEPLSDEDLRVMADSIEEMNKYKENIDDLKQEQKACNEIKKAFDVYNKAVLSEKGDEYLQKRKEYNDIEKQISDDEKTLLESKKIIEENSILLENLDLEKKELIHKKTKLEQSDLKNITRELEELKISKKEIIENKESKLKEKENKERSLNNNQKELKEKKDDIYKLESEFKEILKELESYQEEISFDDAKFYLDDLSIQQFEFNQMPSFINTIKRRIELLEKLKEIAYKIKIQEEKIENDVKKYDEIGESLNKLNTEHKNISNALINISALYKEELAKYFENNKIFKIDDLDSIYKIVDDLDRSMITKIKELLKNTTYEFLDKFKNDILGNTLKINEYKDKISKINLELETIDNYYIKDIDSDLFVFLNENNISYNFFYELIEFKNIDITKKKIIESFLFETGILTSVISNSEFKDNLKYKSLKSKEKYSNNLTKYITVLDSPFKDNITKILESISLDSNSIISILENGKYELAIISGQVNTNYDLKYIGEEVRQEYIKNLKEKLNLNIQEYNKQIIVKEKENEEIEKNISLLNDEFLAIPEPTNLQEHFKLLDKIVYEKELVTNSINEITEEIKNKNKLLEEIKEEFNENKKGYYGSQNYDGIKEILDSTNAYNTILVSINDIFNTYKNKKELLDYYKNIVEEYTTDLDNINYDLHKSETKIIELNNREKTLNEIMDKEYKESGNEYKEITARLETIEKDIPNIRDIITKYETNNVHTMQEIEKNKNMKESIGITKDVLYQIFMDEYNLHYVDYKDISENEIREFIKNLKQNISSKDALNKVVDQQDNYSILTDYAPKRFTIQIKEYNDYLKFTSDDVKLEEISKLFKNAERLDLSFNYLGKNTNLYLLSDSIDASISDYSNLISLEERHLFYDLIMNNIGSSIRNKISNSEKWINEVKKLMESMNISSGLKFSLKWEGIKANGEKEMDTSEIVSIFRKSSEMLTENDYKKIAQHFKSKINSVEEVLDESERNYLEIIKNVLDYRKWFEFKLYFSRGSGDKKELTDKQFNKMSGGEKAIAMYIPLFSCVYAKLGSAKSDAPRIVALDEAFAGVDDGNMKDAFRILGELNLDFILTSQSIWGDFDTVKNLAISELYHPVDSPVVTSINYRWNGIKREKVEDIHEFETI